MWYFKAVISLLALVVFSGPAFGAMTGSIRKIWPAVGLVGGNDALDGVTGFVSQFDFAFVKMATGGVSVYRIDTTGTTTEVVPSRITPDALQTGGTVFGDVRDASGASMWVPAGISGATIWADALVIDGTTYTGGFCLDSELASQVSGYPYSSSVSAWLLDYTRSSGISAYVESQVSGYPHNSSVSAWISSQVSGYPYNSSVSAWLLNYTASSGISGYVESQVSEYPVSSSVSAWLLGYTHSTGLTPYVESQVSGYNTEQRRASIGCAWVDARTGDSIFVVAPFSMTMTGVSIICQQNIEAGISVYIASSGFPATDGSNGLVDINSEGAGTSVYGISGTSTITAFDILYFSLNHHRTAGASNFTVQLFGRKD